jgi:hypothetical protein
MQQQDVQRRQAEANEAADRDTAGRSDATRGVYFPKKAAYPEGKSPKHSRLPPNFAGKDAELDKRLIRACHTDFTEFSQQERRDQFEKDLDTWDKMYWCSLLRPEGKDLKQTKANMAYTGFYRRVNTIHANEISVLIPDNELPARYEPDAVDQGFEVDASEAQRLCDERNLWERFVFEQDDRVQKIRHLNWVVNKEGVAVLSAEWAHKERTVKQRRPVYEAQADGSQRTRFQWQERKRIIKHNPCVVVHDIRDVWFDVTAPDEQATNWVVRKQHTLADLLVWQRNDSVRNVDRIGTAHLYRDDGSAAKAREDMQINAGGYQQEPSGRLILVWHWWADLPIDDKGKWDEDGTIPHTFWCTFAGDIEGGNAEVLRIQANPFCHGEKPFKIVNSMEDNNGQLHMTLGSVLHSGYWEAKTTADQRIDNKNLIIRAPWIKYGSVHTEDLTFNTPNKVIAASFGAKLERVVVPDATGNLLQTAEWIEDDMDKTAGTDKPVTGTPSGGRTSATEAKTVYDQAMKPALAKADYFAEQVFPWMLRMDASLTEQFVDPDYAVHVAGVDVTPFMTYGPFKVRVTAIREFASDTLARQQLGSFIANDYPVLAPEMTPEGRKLVGKMVWRVMRWPNADVVFGEDDIADAMTLARDETKAILFGGAMIRPQQGQNANVHLSIHRQAEREYEASLAAKEPGADRSALERLRLHIDETVQMRDSASQRIAEQAARSQMGGEPEVPQGATEPNPPLPTGVPQASDLVGVNTGNLMEAEEGGLNV